jgi:hypothetical protein
LVRGTVLFILALVHHNYAHHGGRLRVLVVAALLEGMGATVPAVRAAADGGTLLGVVAVLGHVPWLAALDAHDRLLARLSGVARL